MNIDKQFERLANLDKASGELYNVTESLAEKILLPGESVDFNVLTVNGKFYNVIIHGIERLKNGDIVFKSHLDGEYGTKSYYIRQIPLDVAMKCMKRLSEMLPELMLNRERSKWWEFWKAYLKGCFKRSREEGKNIYEALKVAVGKTSMLEDEQLDPDKEEAYKKALDNFLHKWKETLRQMEERVKNGTYDEEDIRVCETCGLPMSSGYSLGGDYACDDDCCLEVYGGDKAQMEEDLSHAEEDWGECYYTEWDSVFFDY